MKTSTLSIIAVTSGNRGESARMLHSLSLEYQQDVTIEEYEVHVIEYDSVVLNELEVAEFGDNFHYHSLGDECRSFAEAQEYGARQANGRCIGAVSQQAPIATPKLVAQSLKLINAFESPVIVVRSFALEDSRTPSTTTSNSHKLLKQIQWPKQPYRLFEFGSDTLSNGSGWFGDNWKSGCLILPRVLFESFTHVDEFLSPFPETNRHREIIEHLMRTSEAQTFALLGEGCFEQISRPAPQDCKSNTVHMLRTDELPPDVTPHFSSSISTLPLQFFGEIHEQVLLNHD